VKRKPTNPRQSVKRQTTIAVARPSDYLDSPSGVRLQKFIADQGIASRRAAEDMIRLGEVTVNGQVAELGMRVVPGEDAVKVRGKLLRQASQAEQIYVKMFKPAKVLTTLSDPEGRTTVKDLLVGVKQRVYPAGRLDYDSEGLVILTNDGAYAQALNHPTKEIRKTYLVKVSGKPTEHHLMKLRAGVTLADGKARAVHIERTKSGDQYDWFKVVLTEGRNQQVRRMFEKIGFDVMKLQRVAIGHITLGRLERGEFKIMSKEEAELALK